MIKDGSYIAIAFLSNRKITDQKTKRDSLKIVLEHKGRYNRPDVLAFLKSHAKTVERVISKMAVKYKIRLPRVIHLRPFYRETPCYGRIIFLAERYYEIILNYDKLINHSDEGRETVLHEIAHLIERELHGSMRHGKKFRRVFADCRKS